MKVLITGGAGYIGSHTNRYFAEMGAETVVLDDLSAGHEAAVTAGRLVVGDFGDRALLRELFSGEGFDAIVHFAALTSVAESVAKPSSYYQNNVAGLINLLDCAVEAGIKNFVFSSSAAVFGEPERTPIDETHPLRPINPYGETKLIGERMLRDYGRAYGLKWCALRYFNAAGAAADGAIGESHSPESHLIPLALQAAQSGKKFKIFGADYPTRDGTCLRDYVHVNDLARAHWLALRRLMNGGASDTFNLGSGSGFTVKEVVESCSALCGGRLEYEIAERREGDPAVLLAGIEKAGKILGWQPEESDLDTILRSALNWELHRRF